MKVLDLFSGIGGFSLGLERAGMETVAFCEIDKFCCEVLNKHWPEVPIHNDITTLNGEQYAGTVGLICGGFPCQDISVAGKQKGISGERSGLWSEYARLIKESKPKFIIIENVPNLRNLGLARVIKDLWSLGYNAEWHIISARAVGALHKRERIFIIAHDCSLGIQGSLLQPLSRQQAFSWCQDVRGIADLRKRSIIHTPTLCRANDGIPARVDRLRSLGNAVVPQIPEIIGRVIMQFNNKERGYEYN